MLDVFCGTASMALACHDYGVEYLGLDISERVILPARARLAAYVMYTQLLGRKSAPLLLGTEPNGPSRDDPIAGVITLANAALLPKNNFPSSNPNDISLRVHGKLAETESSMVVHALNCSCNVDPESSVVTECDFSCSKLIVRSSVLKVIFIVRLRCVSLTRRLTKSTSGEDYTL